MSLGIWRRASAEGVAAGREAHEALLRQVELLNLLRESNAAVREERERCAAGEAAARAALEQLRASTAPLEQQLAAARAAAEAAEESRAAARAEASRWELRRAQQQQLYGSVDLAVYGRVKA